MHKGPRGKCENLQTGMRKRQQDTVSDLTCKEEIYIVFKEKCKG